MEEDERDALQREPPVAAMKTSKARVRIGTPRESSRSPQGSPSPQLRYGPALSTLRFCFRTRGDEASVRAL